MITRRQPTPRRFSLEKLLHMPPGSYEDYVYPIMYNYIKDTAVHQCNAAVAMGNSGDARYIPHLEAELANHDERVRAHVRWALDKLESCAISLCADAMRPST